MIPPSVVNVHIIDQGRKVIGLWLPVFLLWPILLVMFVVAFPFIVLAQIILTCLRIPIRLFEILFATMAVVSSLRGLKVDVAKKYNNQSSVYIDIK